MNNMNLNMINPKIKSLLDLWPQIVAGYHKRCDHYWTFQMSYNCLCEDVHWLLTHDGYCHRDLSFGPFKSFTSFMEWDGKELRQKMLEICRDELNHCEGGAWYLEGDEPDMPKEHWEKLIKKLQNN